MKDINWAVIGVGVIANEMANALLKDNRNIYSVANRTQKKAIDFANKYNIKKVYDNIADVFTDPNVDAIYIATPHNTHLNFIKKAIENNKHVLVAIKFIGKGVLVITFITIHPFKPCFYC